MKATALRAITLAATLALISVSAALPCRGGGVTFIKTILSSDAGAVGGCFGPLVLEVSLKLEV